MHMGHRVNYIFPFIESEIYVPFFFHIMIVFLFPVHHSAAFTKEEYSQFLSIAVPFSIALAVLSFTFEVIQSFYK